MTIEIRFPQISQRNRRESSSILLESGAIETRQSVDLQNNQRQHQIFVVRTYFLQLTDRVLMCADGFVKLMSKKESVCAPSFSVCEIYVNFTILLRIHHVRRS